jgi:hypothetical protein
MSTIKTEEDGWACNRGVQHLASLLDDLDELRYEINNCVRQSSLEDIAYEFAELGRDLVRISDALDTNVEYETIEPQD